LVEHPYVTTTHYGYLTRRELWSPGYEYIDNAVRTYSPGIVALSREIEDGYRHRGYRGFMAVLHNGASVDKIRYTDNPTKGVLCLGKIEDRKQQWLLANLCRNRVDVDYVGPIAGTKFVPDTTQVYLGEWTREQVYQNLTDYSVLVLPSLGEAHALVIPEAIAAGLTVVVTEAASANLHGCPSCRVIPDKIDHTIVDVINSARYNNMHKRHHLRDDAERYFDWNVILEDYINVIIPRFKDYYGLHN
jgi:glycosyltransferase involved in cell wall biosynthesis